MSEGHRGKTALTEENLLTKPLDELDFGPFTHPITVTWARKWYLQMLKHLEFSIKTFRDRRMLVISWLLAVLVGVFGNLFASSLFGRIECSSWQFALIFLAATSLVAASLFWFFPPRFEHTFQVWFGREATYAYQKLSKEFGRLLSHDDLHDFFRVYNLLLVRDCLREHSTRLTKVIDVKVPEYGYEIWVTVQLRRKGSWLRRSVEKDLVEELGLVCELFATTVGPIRWIDEGTPIEQVKTFHSALKSIRFDNVVREVREQILRASMTSMREKSEAVLSTIMRTQNENEMAEESVLYEALKKTAGMDEAEANVVVNHLRKEGVLFSPEPGYLKRTIR